jgi:adenylate cyclase, class 2
MKNREIEVKVLNIDVKKLVLKLDSLGAKRVGEYFYKRIILDFPDNSLDKKDSWIRLRTDGKITTLTYKRKHGSKIEDMEEHEVEVSDFKKTMDLLNEIGLEQKRFQENRRIKYLLGNTQVTIELWPKLKPYMEIESKTKKELLETLKKLKIDINDTTTKTPKETYANIGINLHDKKYKNLKLEKDKKAMKI